MINQQAPLDLWELFINKIAGAGNPYIFVFLSGIVIILAMAKLRMPTNVALALIAVYGILISAFFPSLLPIILFIIGILFAWTISRMLSRG